MSEEKECDPLAHVKFPEVRSFRICQEDLRRKLREIDQVFEEIERRRAAMGPMHYEKRKKEEEWESGD